MAFSYTLEFILAQLPSVVEVIGETTETIRGLSSLQDAKSGDLSFLGNPKYRKDLADSAATVILVPKDLKEHPRPNQVYVLVDNPSAALGQLCTLLAQQLWPAEVSGIHPTAVISAEAIVDETVTVGPYCVIGAGASIGPGSVLGSHVVIGRFVEIGADCRIGSHVTLLDYCVLGHQVVLHPGVVIGSDGYGYETTQGVHHKLPHIGRVVLEDEVEVGANTAIDRARFGETRIGRGTKIDNLVQVAHNVKVGRGCFLVAQTGIAGSTELEDYVVLGGQAGVAGHLHIGRGSKIGAQSGVSHDLPPGSYERGSPSYPYFLAQKIHILMGRLPELFQRVSALEQRHANPDQS